MSSIGDWFHSTVKQVTGKSPQEHADDIKSALPAQAKAIMTDSSSAKALGASPESLGKTMTGGRRRKSRGGKKSRKTRRGGKKSWY